MFVQFRVPAVPVAQPRPKATLAAGGKHARVHEVTHVKGADGVRRPHPIAAFKATVRMAAQAAYSGPPTDEPLRVDVTFVFPRTANMIWKTRPMPRVPHAKKPDRDNMDKAVLDALKGLFWLDDCQVYAGTIEKWIAAGDEQPHVLVTVSTDLTDA